MAVSLGRKRFRRALYVVLALSFGFMATASYHYIRVKNDPEHLKNISPELFKINVLAHRGQALFLNEDDEFRIAMKFYRRSFQSPVYSDASYEMILSLAERNYPPAQMMIADYIMRSQTEDPEAYEQAVELYRSAAAQNHEPAINKLALLDRVDELAPDDSSP